MGFLSERRRLLEALWLEARGFRYDLAIFA
jgi:hypothetical protein